MATNPHGCRSPSTQCSGGEGDGKSNEALRPIGGARVCHPQSPLYDSVIVISRGAPWVNILHSVKHLF